MAEQRPFGRRGAGPTPQRPARPGPGRPGSGKPVEPDRPEGAAMVAAARKRTLGLSLATAGALTAAGLWFAESVESPCLDDPTTTVDEKTTGDCAAPASATATGRHGGGFGYWVWRSNPFGRGVWSGRSVSTASASAFQGTASRSTASRGGFGSIGSFHLFGGS